jgi:protein SCO1/2
LLVSVDPARDTPPVIAEYLESQQVADFVTGLAGVDSVLQQITLDYGLYFQVPPDAEPDGDYLVDHSTLVYLVDPEGRLVTIYDFGTEPEVIAEDIREMLGK